MAPDLGRADQIKNVENVTPLFSMVSYFFLDKKINMDHDCPPIELKSWNISSIKHSNDFEESRILIFCNPSRTFYSCTSRPGKINRGPTAKTGRASISGHALPRPWRKCCDVVSSSDLFFEFTTLNGIFSRLSGWALSWSHLVIYLFMLTRTKAKSRRTVAKSPQETKKR